MTQDQIQLVVEFSIEQGKLEQFKQYIHEMTNSVKQNESAAKSYQWYLNQDKTTSIVTEVYDNSDAVLAHLNGDGVRTILVPKILSVAKVTRFEVYGNISKQLQVVLTNFSSQNYGYVLGFSKY